MTDPTEEEADLAQHWEEELPYFTPKLSSSSTASTLFKIQLKPKQIGAPEDSIYYFHEHEMQAR